ncbi:hypothetical protein, partial [Xanthomonas campestris]
WHATADIKALRALGDWGFFRGDYLCAPVLRFKHTTTMLEAPHLTEDDLNGQSQRIFEDVRFAGCRAPDS